MTIDSRTPVLVGVGAIQQRVADGGAEAVELMIQAVARAAEDAGNRDLPGKAQLIGVPRGTWSYRDPGRLIADHFGAPARSVLAQVGVLQQSLITRVCAAIEDGDLDIAIVCGGEARYRERQAARTGTPAGETVQAGHEPDELLVPEGDILAGLEIQRGLAMPAHQYAIMENALRAADGQDLDAHEAEIAALWASFSAVAVRNPDAWTRRELAPSGLREESPENRPIAFPYRRLNVSQWTVDQAAAMIIVSAEAAQGLGLDRDAWLFPLAAAESNAMTPLSQRAQLHRCPGARAAGAALYSMTGVGADDVAHIDLYSCFPVAVRMQSRELGIGTGNGRALTVTGGMTFAGGPLNNYVFQSVAKMAEVLRADPGSVGLITCISGMMTKQAVAQWSSKPPPVGFRWADVSAEVGRENRPTPLVPDAAGPATIAGYTVLATDGRPSVAVAIADLPDGGRTIVVSDTPSVAASMCNEEWVSRQILVQDGRFLAT